MDGMGIEFRLSLSIYLAKGTCQTDELLKLFVAWRVLGKLFHSWESQLRNSGLLYMCALCNAGKRSKGMQEG